MTLIDADKLWEELNAIGGCGAEPGSWSDGWDRAIDEAISLVDNAPVVNGGNQYIVIPRDQCSIRQIVQYGDWENYTVPEIAAILNASVSTVWLAIHDGRCAGVDVKYKKMKGGWPRRRRETHD